MSGIAITIVKIASQMEMPPRSLYHYQCITRTEAAMDESNLQQHVLSRLGLRIEPEMSRYLGRKLAGGDGPFTIIGGDARTGIPRREIVQPALFAGAALNIAAQI
jgi:hypothetical protein